MEFLNKADLKQRQEFDRFVSQHPNGSIMQSLRWAGVKANWDYEAIVVRGKQGQIVASALILIKRVPVLGASLFYAPRGPVFSWEDQASLQEILRGVMVLSKRYHAYAFLMDPAIRTDFVPLIQELKEMGFEYQKNAPELSTIQTRNNYMLSLKGKNEEALLASFQSKCRYNIRLAKRKGVICRVCGKEGLDDFCRLMEVTGERDGFCTRKKEYFARMLDALGPYCRLYLCYYQGVAVSGAIATQYAGKTCYVYGASSSEHRNVMPNYLMQWEMIRWALENGCTWYDFQGIPFYWDETHPNYGVYRFKRGFQGEVVTYAGEFKLYFSNWKRIKVKTALAIFQKARHTVGILTQKTSSKYFSGERNRIFTGKPLPNQVKKPMAR